MALKMAQREKMGAKEFALPGRGSGKEGKGPGSYPIDSKARARNALARGAQNASPKEQGEIKRAVEKKYPSIKVGGEKKGGKK